MNAKEASTMTLPSSLEQLISALRDLPAIGPRQATRIAFYLVRIGGQRTAALKQALEAAGTLGPCPQCYFPSEGRMLCVRCADKSRDQKTIMILEKETDLISLEKTGKYKGTYLIMGAIGKLGDLEPWQIVRIEKLTERITKDMGGTADEIIVALNPNTEGDWNAEKIVKRVAPLAKRLTRLGRGLPTGGEIEFADEETLGHAFEGRR
jgi:recombination protein RecR